MADKTIKGHMVQTLQGVRSTKPKKRRKRGVEELPEIDEPTPGNDSVNELYVRLLQKNMLYTDDTGRLPIRDRSDNQNVMVAYPSLNLILVELFSSRKYKNRLEAYNVIMQRLKEKISLLTYTFWTTNVARSTRQP